MNANNEVAVFGGGCFWCTEAVFKMLKGVTSVLPGYGIGESGKDLPRPHYDDVARGMTDFVECAEVEYDPSFVKYRDLLTVFFGSHDPTSVNRQGADTGTQYRSVIFFTTPEQKEVAEMMISELNAESKFGLPAQAGKPIVTDVEPLGNFFAAEEYHKDYYAKNTNSFYCQIVINPKLEKVQKEFADLLDKNKLS